MFSGCSINLFTVAKNEKGNTETIFYWKEEALAYKTPSTPQELCNDVSAKLNKLTKEYDLSSFTLIPTEQFGLPTICAGNIDSQNISSDCEKVLLTLPRYDNKSAVILANEILSKIINQNIPYENLALSDVFIGGYQVNLFDDSP